MSNIDSGDTVRHIPSDEEWLVAFVENGRLCACGWPCSLVPLADCVLLKKATPEERYDLLKKMACITGSDPRQSYAARILEAAPANAAEAPAIDTPRDFAREMAEMQNGPPLIGRWHHGDGVLVSGSIRVARWDCDTNPGADFRDKVLGWVSDSLNAALSPPSAAPTSAAEPAAVALACKRCGMLGRDADARGTPHCTYCGITDPDAATTESAPAAALDGYRDAFYELGKLMGIGAQDASPETVWREQMLPRLQAAFAPAAAVAVEMPPLNDELTAILGRMCFQCIRLAHALRLCGVEISTKAENEQATVIHFLLTRYMRHGADWAKHADADLRSMLDQAEAKKKAKGE